jgi:mycothiol synthase
MGAIIARMIIRPAIPGDTPSIRRVCEEALDLEPDGGELPLALAAGAAERRRFCLVADEGHLTGVCYGSLGRRGAPRGHIDLLAVAPGARRRGIGRRLLAEAEAGLAALGVSEVVLAGNPPAHLWPGVDPRYTAMTVLAEESGYQRHGDAVDMTVSLDDASLVTEPDERRLAEAGITIRRASSGEAAAVVAWLRDGPWGDSAWPDEVAAALARDPAGCHLAWRDGYLGFACHGVVRRGWFGPMGTADVARGHGIGTVLLNRCLADMRAAGLPTARIGWVGPIRFYADVLGARIERVYWKYSRELSDDANHT